MRTANATWQSVTTDTPAVSWLHRYARACAAFGLVLITAGGLVTSTGSGLAVPDWPLSFGQLFPRMEGGVLFEHGHRLVAATFGLLVVVLAVWSARIEPRAWVRRLAWVLLALVILQGLLGGATVLLRLPDAISIAHAGLAQIVFGLTVSIATIASPDFRHGSPRSGDSGSPAVRTLTVAAAVAVYAQILLGALVRHTGAGLAIPDFPLSFGRLIPAFDSPQVAYQFAHRAGAVLAVTLVAWAALAALGRFPEDRWLARPAMSLLVLAALQIGLGAATVWTARAVVPTTAHVVVGALLFAGTVLLAVRAHRRVSVATGVAARFAPREAVG